MNPRATLLAVGFACLLGSLLLLGLGESPSIFWEAAKQCLFDGYGLSYTFYYMTPLLFTGLAVAMGLQCGLLNLGCEGQLLMASLACVVVGTSLPGLPWYLALPLTCAVAAVAAGMWAGLAIGLKLARGVHEILSGILLNFVAVFGVSYLILNPLKNPASENPESLPIAGPFTLPWLSHMFPRALETWNRTPVNLALPIGFILSIALYALLRFSRWGYEVRAVGLNPLASQYAGISVSQKRIQAFCLSGICAGGVALHEVLGSHHRMAEGFAAGVGYTGIAVALVARNNPLWVPVSAFFFGFLHNWSLELELASSKISREVAWVFQALLVAALSIQALPWRRKTKGGS